jgi:RNA-binding protein YlmH
MPEEQVLDMLESLLGITEQTTEFLNPEDYAEWQRISAKTADLRMISDGGNPGTDV